MSDEQKPVCTSTSGMSMCELPRGHEGQHHDMLSGRSW